MEKDDVDVMDLDDAGPAIAPLPYPTEDTDGAEYDGFIQDVDDVKIVQCHYGGVLPELPTPTPPSTPFVSENQDDLFGTRVELPSLPEIEHRQHQGVGRPAPAKRVEETRRLGTSDEPPMGYFATIDSPANLAAAQGLRLDPATGHLFFGTNPKPLAKFEMRSPEHVRKEAEALARLGIDREPCPYHIVAEYCWRQDLAKMARGCQAQSVVQLFTLRLDVANALPSIAKHVAEGAAAFLASKQMPVEQICDLVNVGLTNSWPVFTELEMRLPCGALAWQQSVHELWPIWSTDAKDDVARSITASHVGLLWWLVAQTALADLYHFPLVGYRPPPKFEPPPLAEGEKNSPERTARLEHLAYECQSRLGADDGRYPSPFTLGELFHYDMVATSAPLTSSREGYSSDMARRELNEVKDFLEFVARISHLQAQWAPVSRGRDAILGQRQSPSDPNPVLVIHLHCLELHEVAVLGELRFLAAGALLPLGEDEVKLLPQSVRERVSSLAARPMLDAPLIVGEWRLQCPRQ